MEGHQKFLGGGGLKSQILEAKYEAKLEFPEGMGGVGRGEYGYFLELQNLASESCLQELSTLRLLDLKI